MLRFTWHGDRLIREWERAAQAGTLAAARRTAHLCRDAVSTPYPPPSQPGEPPHLRTGAGQAAISYRPVLDSPTPAAELFLRESGIHLLYLEVGTERIAPRPWLMPTLLAHQHDIYLTGLAAFRRSLTP